jgi:hypothetical protein
VRLVSLERCSAHQPRGRRRARAGEGEGAAPPMGM